MFGVPYSCLDLAFLPKYESEIPVVLTILHCYLRYNKGLELEGIFRINGKEQTFLDAMSRMDQAHCLYDIDVDNYIVAQLIKAFFREYEIASPGFFNDDILNARQEDNIKLQFSKMKEPLKSVILWLLDLCLEVKYLNTLYIEISSKSQIRKFDI